MLGDTNLTDPHQVEQLHRSIAMLPPGAEALGREDAMRVLAELGQQLGAKRRR